MTLTATGNTESIYRKERFNQMSEVKKPVATVKASFHTAPAVKEAETAVKAAEAKKEKTEKKAPAAKKAETETAAVKKAAVTEVKAAPAKKAAPAEKKVAPAAEKKEEKKVAVRKTTAAKKAEPAKKAAPVKKEAAPAKKAEAVKAEVVLQWGGNDYTQERLVQSAKDVWQYDLGRDVADFKSVELYVKPEDGKVYAVVNGTEDLSFNI